MKKMNKLLIVVLFCANVLFAQSASEDELIVEAIFFTKKNPKEAALKWKELFKSTNNESYLVEYFYTALRYKNIKDVVKELKAVLQQKKSKELYELLANLYTKEGDAKGLTELLGTMSNKDLESMYELAYLYTIQEEDDKAYALYSKIYDKQKSWESLKGMVAILARKKELRQAQELLWRGIKQNKKLPKEAYLVYMSLVDKRQEPQKALYALQKLYKLTKDKAYLKPLIGLYLYTKDHKDLISLLKATHYDDPLLYEIYTSKKQFVEAYRLLFTLKQSSKPKWFAEEAILTYEIASKYKSVDKKVLGRVNELFEKALKLGVKDDNYYNYYGYILIDHNIDIQKGIKLVQDALKFKPKDVYYLDSLGWGYEKLHKCKKAKEIFEKIEKQAQKWKLEDDIIKHIKSVKSCKEQ